MNINNPSALKAYTSQIDLVKSTNSGSTVKDESQFHEMVNAKFNKLAKMSPGEIVNQVQTANLRCNPSSQVSSFVSSLHKKMQKQEELSVKGLVGKASMTDIVIASAEASGALRVATKFRNAIQKSLSDIFNMQV